MIGFESYDKQTIWKMKKENEILKLVENYIQESMIETNLRFITTIALLEFFRRFIYDLEQPLHHIEMDYAMGFLS